MKIRWLSPFVRRLALREWLMLFIGLLTLAIALGWQNGLGRLDQSLYDLFLSIDDNKPVREDVIIVAIDDYSLAELGRWPWSRNLHADLINKLTQARPRAIGLDVILSETSTPQNDAQLAAAIAHSQRVVLPVVLTNAGQGLTAGLPIPILAESARALGHINLEHDSDGVIRSVFLREGQNGKSWLHFSAALISTGSGMQYSGTGALPVAPTASLIDTWQRGDQLYIPYEGGIGHFKSVPYVSVLRGEVPDEFFTDKYVLVGATALGMADSYPTPVSRNSGAMPGIEINANILASLLDGEEIHIAAPWQTALFNAFPVFMALLGYLLLSPRFSLFATGIWMLMTLVASYIGLHMGIWIAPAAAVITLIISYPLWSWRRLEAAITYLGQEFTRLDQEPHLLPEEKPVASANEVGDVLEQRISAMENAARRVRDLRQFVSDNLDNLPDATLVTSVEGQVLLANKHANDYYSSLGIDNVLGRNILDLLAQLKNPQPVDQAANLSFDWPDLLDMQRSQTLNNGISVQDHKGRDLLVKSSPCNSAANLLTGWIVSVLDISTIRAAERSRDETLRFLSHDMRAPQASILALLELQSETSSALPQAELFARIEKASRKTLGLADNFVQLARAESHEYRLEEVDFQDVLFDATDEMWSLAKSRHISVQMEISDGEYPVKVDRTLMTRALANLLSNAINYSPDHTSIICSVRLDRDAPQPRVVCRILDHGYGIAEADQGKLFLRFQRVDLPNQPRHDGVGLGLVFVKTVIERHQGDISFISQAGVGTSFTLMLPVCHDV
ncbi:histidine kinase [Herminiimonas sp. KBW02]|uniref:CHASE2 domain-containing protein n=1 Tax=Herminiimonas sp. KBW02 TaxID=2153363 RepID=UPI000F59B3D7|nr:CHASE2 domain-containing protein [Herminiimonas sp. KBW02]RQO37419.1 histidine kinase [Herminiimonas sp. KBW02]